MCGPSCAQYTACLYSHVTQTIFYRESCTPSYGGCSSTLLAGFYRRQIDAFHKHCSFSLTTTRCFKKKWKKRELSSTTPLSFSLFSRFTILSSPSLQIRLIQSSNQISKEPEDSKDMLFKCYK